VIKLDEPEGDDFNFFECVYLLAREEPRTIVIVTRIIIFKFLRACTV
jgi:hypothetical protein